MENRFTTEYLERIKMEKMLQVTPTGLCPFVYCKYNGSITTKDMLENTTYCLVKCMCTQCPNYGKESPLFRKWAKATDDAKNKRLEAEKRKAIEPKPEVKSESQHEDSVIHIGGLHFPASWAGDLATSMIDDIKRKADK